VVPAVAKSRLSRKTPPDEMLDEDAANCDSACAKEHPI
jgi:hypothetical protein